MPEDLVEKIAIRIAVASNSGTWATHYTEEQKALWRLRSPAGDDHQVGCHCERGIGLVAEALPILSAATGRSMLSNDERVRVWLGMTGVGKPRRRTPV
jgi:hypothetical protein